MTPALVAAVVSALDLDALVLLRGMRSLVPIASAPALSDAELMRLLQVNFDTALDAFFVSQDRLRSCADCHARSEPRHAYTSGGAVFGGEDSADLFQELLDGSEDLWLGFALQLPLSGHRHVRQDSSDLRSLLPRDVRKKHAGCETAVEFGVRSHEGPVPHLCPFEQDRVAFGSVGDGAGRVRENTEKAVI